MIIKKLHRYIVVLVLFLSQAINGQETDYKTITINPYLTFQNYEHFKRLTLSSPDASVEYISGFKFQWGYSYKLRVKKVRLEAPLSDGTSYEYTLQEIISKTKEPDSSTCTLFLDSAMYYNQVNITDEPELGSFQQLTDNRFLYLNAVVIEVPDSLLEDFKQILTGQSTRLGTFKYLDNKIIQLLKLD